MAGRLFTSESVTEGHPDKICDAISDSILDAMLASDPASRVAVETLVTTGQVHVVGEVTTALGIHSPSRVFMGIGGNVGEGMRLGLEQSATGVLGAMGNIAGDLSNTTLTPPATSLSGLASASTAAAASQGGAPFQINAYGVDANEVAMKVGRKVDRRLGRMAVQG